MKFVIFAIALTAVAAPGPRNLPPNMFPVKPVVSRAQPAELRITNGRNFSYALPSGWRVGEDGQFALTLVSADNKALTVMVGNAGLPPNYNPGRFVYEKMMALQPMNLQVGQPRQVSPIAGFGQAYQFDVQFMWRGSANRGVAKCHIANAYDSAVMAMTLAFSEAGQWGNYASWLPAVADQISATNGGAFGRRGIMAQNLQNSTAYAQAARQYREWSQKNWQGVVDQRNASNDRNNFHFRENLGNIQTYTNPYDSRVPLELPTTYQYFWVDRQGNILGTNDSGANPNAGSTADWKQMPKHRP